MNLPQKIYLVFKNSDLTEGRGPMVFHSAWKDKSEAIKFMDRQPGVMGRRGVWSEQKYGDWECRETDLL